MSPSLRAERLSFSYGSRALLDGASFHLAPGWTGLVGPNGAGKSTLLSLLAGQLTPTGGALHVEPRAARVVLCPQRVESIGAAERDFAAADDGLAFGLRGRLALDEAQLDRWSTLSPGERKRWQLGAALWSEPAVLLLDEPTNHLDAEGSALVVGALRRFRGVGVLVSHDRALLDGLTRATLSLDHGAVREYPGAFSAASRAWAGEDQRLREAQREARRRLEVDLRQLEASRQRHEASGRSRRASVRMRNAGDSDARGISSAYRAETAERAHAAQLRRQLARAADVREQLEALAPRDDPGRRLVVSSEPAPRPVIASLLGEVRLPSGAALLRGVSVVLRRGEHVVVEGPNGAGKSTLLRAVVEAAGLPPERVLSLPQELTSEDAEADLVTLHELPDEQRGRVLQLAHAVGVEPEQLLRTERPSPGEARKLRLALGLGLEAWLAVLDEPTNHLDLPAIERLEEALVAFPGALVLVTHDAALASRVAKTRWRVRDGAVQVLG